MQHDIDLFYYYNLVTNKTLYILSILLLPYLTTLRPELGVNECRQTSRHVADEDVPMTMTMTDPC